MLKNKRYHKEHANKERNQRIMNVYSSQQTLSQLPLKAPSLPLKKNNKQSSSNLLGKSKEKLKKDKNKSRSSIVKIKAPEIYERIPVNIAHSNTNSEIEFSNYGETIKEGNRVFRKHLFIDCDKESIMREIWNMDRRKKYIENQAATKIQKVFRGFMTRKLLQKYIEQYEEKLKAEISQIKRKGTFLSSHQEDSFYDCSIKQQSYFLSDKKRQKKRGMFGYEENENHFEYESSIRENQHMTDHFISIQEPDLYDKFPKEERKASFPEKSNLTLNESSIHHPEVSLSFGYQIEPSPHFLHPSVKNDEGLMASPIDVRKGQVGLSEDNTRDGFSQNLTISPNYYQKNKSDKSQSHLTSLQKYYQSDDLTNKVSQKKMEKLKSSEKAKWEQVIEFVNHNLQGNFDYEKTKGLMSAILQFSVRNREELNKIHQEEPSTLTPTTFTQRNEHKEQAEDDQEFKERGFKKKKWEEGILLQKSLKNENMPLSRQVEKSVMERTSIMKEYFLKNMYIEDQQIDKMMQLRESVLRKKQSESLKQLNYQLENNLLTQDDFLDRLSKMTHAFHNQKKDIEQIKVDIYQGYKAQLQLFQKTALDAKFLGFYLPFSRSMEIFPHQPKWRFDDVMIDELNSVACRKFQSKNEDHQEQQRNKKIDMKEMQGAIEELPQPIERELFEDSSSEHQQNIFSIKQTEIYNRIEPFLEENLLPEQQETSPKKLKQISPYSKFSAVSVFETLDPGNDKEENLLDNINEKQEASCVALRRQVYKINSESEEQEYEDIFVKKEEQKKAEKIADFCIKKLVWEVIQDICVSPKLFEKLTSKTKNQGPEPLVKVQLIDFLQMCLNQLPDFQTMKCRVNQKMYPNLKELLYSMRDFEDEDEQSEYIQIGHYQYILNQQICFSLIERYLDQYRQRRKNLISTVTQIPQGFKEEYIEFSSTKLRHLSFEHKIISSNRAKHLQDYRQEILRIQLHMLFDVWNEQLIKYRQSKNGYSGIGLNEISQSMIDRVSKEMKTQEEYQLMMSSTEKLIEDKIRSTPEGEPLYEEEYEQYVCNNNSQWIYYTQQALEYGFDIIRMVEIELIFEFLNEISSFQKQDYLQQINENPSIFEDQETSQLNSEQELQLQNKIREFDEQIDSNSQDSFYS